jgi:2,3-bisphosphoglycerate-independent phosphoglycerate mutase
MDADALIAEIATRHGVAVSRDDPVMILATLNDLLAKENAEKQAEMLAQFRREMETVSEKWANDAKARAQAMLAQSLEIQQTSAARQIEKAFERVEKSRQPETALLSTAAAQLKWMLAANILASLLTFAAAGLVVLAGSPS